MTNPTDDGPTISSLAPFLALSFGLTWGIAALAILTPQTINSLFGPFGYTNPLFILAVYSPGFAAVLLVWRRRGRGALKRFFQRLTLWRMPLMWWALLLIGIPALFYLGAALKGNTFAPFPFDPWYSVLPALATALLIGPIEEFGWRGLALPLLQRRLTPFWAGLLLGIVWGVWHIPAFLIGGTPQSAWAFGPYFVAVVAISVLLTPMFNASRGSLLVAALFHFQMNNPLWPDAQPWDTLVFVLAATMVVMANREAMFTRAAASTEVLMPEREMS